MIILRMKLRNFRGVDDRDVEFDPVGVTILEGPNEAGKTSHIDALNLLLDYKSSSRHRDVLATRPVHRDEGPEAEIEVRAGDYHFKYRKRLIKSQMTELEIIAPKPENLTSDEAHERVMAILSETTDLDLWRALRIMQGDGLRAVDLHDAKALGKALDVSVGATPVSDEETGLFQAVTNEYRQYWTSSGKENKELKQAEADVPRLDQELRDAQSNLHAVETDIEQLETLQSELKNTRTKRPELEDNVEKTTAAWEKAQTAVDQENQARTAFELALERHNQAANAKAKLNEHTHKATKARELLKEHHDAVASAPNLTQAREALSQHEQAFDETKEARQEAETVERLRQADTDNRHFAFDLEQMRERKTAIDKARAKADQARKFVATSQATDANLAKLREALDQRGTATARLSAAAPHLLVEQLGTCEVRVDGQVLEMAAGTVDRRIDAETLIEVADHARIVVTPGGDLHQMRKAVDKLQDRVKQLFALIGADDWNTAAEANRLLAKAQGQMDEVTRIEKDKLRDLTYDSLNERIDEVDAQVDEYLHRRESELPMPDGFDEARELLAAAQADAKAARANEQSAERPLNDARTRYQGLEKAHAELNTRTEVLQTQVNITAKDLEDARQEQAKAPASLEELDEALKKRKAAWDEARNAVESNDPDTAKAKLDNATAVLSDHDTRTHALDRDLTAIKARIEVHEEDGLFERCQTLETEIESARRSASSMRRRADAAHFAYTIFLEERDAARQAYVRPFQDAIERLGRIIYGESFKVTVGEDLSVTHRTLDNRTLRFDQLSAGAKEQLGILTRAACAILVAKDGQIPLILDDTLGNTDEQRLEAMGAVLNLAGRELQVIILTCMPDRFRHVGGATVVRIGRGNI